MVTSGRIWEEKRSSCDKQIADFEGQLKERADDATKLRQQLHDESSALLLQLQCALKQQKTELCDRKVELENKESDIMEWQAQNARNRNLGIHRRDTEIASLKQCLTKAENAVKTTAATKAAGKTDNKAMEALQKKEKAARTMLTQHPQAWSKERERLTTRARNAEKTSNEQKAEIKLLIQQLAQTTQANTTNETLQQSSMEQTTRIENLRSKCESWMSPAQQAEAKLNALTITMGDMLGLYQIAPACQVSEGGACGPRL